MIGHLMRFTILFFVLAQAYGQLGMTLGGLGNSLDGVVSGSPSYTVPQQQHQLVKLPNGKLVLVPMQAAVGRGGGLVDVASLVGGLGLPLGRKKRMIGDLHEMIMGMMG